MQPAIRPDTPTAAEKARRLRRIVRGAVCFWAALVALLCFRDLGRWRALEARGVRAPATVTDKSVSRGKSTTYSLRLTFAADGGRTLRRWKPVSRARYDATPVGGEVTVTHLPGDPEVFEVGAVTRATLAEKAGIWVILVLIFAAGGAAGLIFAERYAASALSRRG